MKKNYLLLAGLASMMAFSACSNDDDLGITPDQGKLEAAEGTTFEIAVSNSGSGMTKATRPMGSSAADNNVNAVKVVFYKWDAGTNEWKATTSVAVPGEDTQLTSGQIAMKVIEGTDGATETDLNTTQGVITFNANVSESTDSPTTPHYTKRATIQVWGLEDGAEYRIVAYGYNNTPNAVTFDDDSDNNGVYTATQPSGNAYNYSEVFADYENTAAASNNDGKVVFTTTPSLTLTRQVAGMLAYLKNVPVRLPDQTADHKMHQVEKIAIVASHTSAKTFSLPNTLMAMEVDGSNEDFNGGAATATEETLMEFIMENCAINYQDKMDAGVDFYTFNQSNSKKPYAEGYTAPTTDADGENLQIRENTIFGARYLVPFDKDYEGYTMKLVFYYDADKELASPTGTPDYQVLKEREITTNNVDYDKVSYDIRCNHFYSIGLKTDTDDNTDIEEDDPMDLTSQNFNLRINDAWAVLHEMELE